jgi:DNA-binding IclR family transcriptional regulator
MVKVLKKAFNILELVWENHKTPLNLGELAEEAGLPQPTCSRIVKDLIEMEYLELHPNKKVYILGPKAYMLGAGEEYRGELKELAEPVIKKCAETVMESVLLAVVKNGKRYILFHYNGNPEIQVILDKECYDDVYRTATGRLLLAFSSRQEVARFVKRNGIPGERWDGMDSDQKLYKELKKIREAGYIFDSNGAQLSMVSFPVMQGGNIVAALGVSVPHSNFASKKEIILREAGMAAKIISDKLSGEEPCL